MNNEGLNFVRPKNFDSFFGQKQIVNELKVYIYSANKRNEPLSHVLLYGPSGMGKTSLSFIIANETDSKIKVINAPMIETIQDLVEILASINEKDILFIDEIHRLDRRIEETLYSVMEDFVVNIPYKSGDNLKLIGVKIPKFTLIGATTLDGLISVPLKNRFPIQFHFENYNLSEMMQILINNSKLYKLEIDEKCAKFFASRTKNNPRILNNLLRRFSDYLLYFKISKVDLEVVEKFFKFIKIDEYGINDFDKKVIATLYENFQDQPTSLESIASLINENVYNIKENSEPYLVSIGFIRRTRRGRILTDRGKLFYWNNIKSWFLSKNVIF